MNFSLQCAWLLDAYSSDVPLPSQKKSNGIKLKKLILSDELRPSVKVATAANIKAPLTGNLLVSNKSTAISAEAIPAYHSMRIEIDASSIQVFCLIYFLFPSTKIPTFSSYWTLDSQENTSSVEEWCDSSRLLVSPSDSFDWKHQKLSRRFEFRTSFWQWLHMFR